MKNLFSKLPNGTKVTIMKHTFERILATTVRGQGKMMLLCAAFLCSVMTEAQVFNSQTDANSEEAVKAEIVDNGDIIHVGYDGINNSPLHDGFIFKSNIAGTVAWYTRVSVAGAAAGSETVLNKVIRGQNGHYYATGWCRPGSGIGAGVFQTIICEFNPTTGALMNKQVRNNGTDMRLLDLCQLDNGAIAAVGSYNSKALVMIYDAALNFTTLRTFTLPPPSRAIFTAVTHDANMIIAGGNVSNVTSSDGILTYIDATNPALPVYSSTFDYTPATVKIGTGSPMNQMRFNKLFYDNTHNYVIANTSIFSGNAEDGAILEINNATNLVSNGIQYGDAANSMSNSVRDGLSIINFTPGNGDYIVGLSPGNAVFNSSTTPLPVPPPSTVLARITANAVTVNRINQQGQTLFTTFTDNNLLYSAGYTTNAPISGALDIFDQSSDYNMTPAGVPACVSDYPVNLMSVQIPVQAILWSPVQDPSTPGDDPTWVQPVSSNLAHCGTPPNGNDSCSLQCYWRVTGNTIVMPNNIFGTLNGASIDIRTNNLSRAVVDGTTGYVGIKQLLPSTTLEVDCSATTAPSGLRLINLPQHEGRALVVDPATGDVFMAQSTIYKPAGDTKELQDQINNLQQQLNSLTDLLNGTGKATEGGNMLSISPNPTDGKATATYSISGTFSKAAIRIVDNAGRIIQEIPVTSGSGSVKIAFPGGTASNQLMCTLMVDNKIAATQKVMLLNK